LREANSTHYTNNFYNPSLCFNMELKEVEREISEIKAILQRIENIVTSRLIGVDEPEEDEIEEIQDYENRKKEGNLELNEI